MESLQLPKSDPLVLMAWGAPGASEGVVQRYQEFAQAGYTHGLVGFGSIDKGRSILDAAQAAGIKVIPLMLYTRVKEITVTAPQIAQELGSHPALGGYCYTDEPSTQGFAELAAVARETQAIDPDPAKVHMVNLLPSFATKEQLGIGQHQKFHEYVHKFMTEVPVNVLSFDFYPIHRFSIDPTWYGDMKDMLEASQLARIPWWSYIATVGFNAYPEPNMGSLRLTTYTNLAYGAVGIEHWFYNYYQGHRASAIDIDGSRTVTYDYIQQVNAEVQALAGVFIGSTVKRVRYAGVSIPPQMEAFAPRGGMESVSATGKGAIVSELWKGNDRFLVIVNQDYLDPTTVEVAWRDSKRVGLVQKDASVQELAEPGLKMVVGPGDAIILMWQTAPK